MASRERIATFFDIERRRGRITAFAIQFLILASLVSYAVSTLPHLSADSVRVLEMFEYLCLVVFTAEYALRLYSAPQRWQFVRSFYGLVDLFAILPFYFGAGPGTLSLRLLRMLRLVRLLKLVRYSRAMERLARAIRETSSELVMFLLVSLAFIYLAAVGIYHFEHDAQPEVFQSVIHSLWWAVATLTTVGYGDVYPVTAGGKFFTSLVVLVGVGIVAVPSGLLAAALTRERQEDERRD